LEVLRAQEGQRDSVLLKRFVEDNDESAFEVLVQRHGPMVMGVCRRILVDAHDAEDAFQATFLVMARRAGTIRNPDAVGAWLYAVARQVAVRSRKARRQRDRLQVHTSPGTDPADGGDSAGVDWQELRPVLDEELGRLPEKYRAAVVLCYLQDRSNTEAAEELGWPVGTVKGRLARARSLLQNRLTRRGVALGAAFATPAALSAEVPPDLATATAREAVQVAGGAAPSDPAVSALYRTGLRATRCSKAPLIGAVLAFLVGCALLAVLFFSLTAGRHPPLPASRTVSREKARRALTPEGTQPPGVALATRLVGARDFYTLDLGGLSATEFRRQLAYARRPGFRRPTLPPSPRVGLRLEVTNTGKEEVRIRTQGLANTLTLELEGPGAVYAPFTALALQPIRRPTEVVVAPGKTALLAEVPTLAFPWPGVGSRAYWTAPGKYRLMAGYRLHLSPAPRGAPDAGDGFGQVLVYSAPTTLQVVEPR
jgi:RNA polymerase sigma factor (sigma-70 family)